MLFVTPHVNEELPLTLQRELSVRENARELSSLLAPDGLEIRIGFELNPAVELVGNDASRYSLDGYGAVLIECPLEVGATSDVSPIFATAEKVEAVGLLPILAHPERSPAMLANPRAASEAALVLAEYRASYRGRSTPVNAWWGSFDLAVNLFSGLPADPPSDDFIMRNAMDSQEVAVGWWPGDARYGKAAFYAYAHPAPAGFADAAISPAAARWDAALGLYVLEWDDVAATADPFATSVEFARSVFRHACEVCEWDPALAATAEGTPPPIA